MNELIQKITACIEACNTCHDACLMEADVKSMVECIRLDKDCAEVCTMTLNLAYKQSPFLKQAAELCMTVCKACGEECGRFGDMDHCRRCAQACDECAKACGKPALG